MKFGPLIEYKLRNIFPEKSYTKCGGETIPRPFPKKSKLSISLVIFYYLTKFHGLVAFTS